MGLARDVDTICSMSWPLGSLGTLQSAFTGGYRGLLPRTPRRFASASGCRHPTHSKPACGRYTRYGADRAGPRQKRRGCPQWPCCGACQEMLSPRPGSPRPEGAVVADTFSDCSDRSAATCPHGRRSLTDNGAGTGLVTVTDWNWGGDVDARRDQERLLPDCRPRRR